MEANRRTVDESVYVRITSKDNDNVYLELDELRQVVALAKAVEKA